MSPVVHLVVVSYLALRSAHGSAKIIIIDCAIRILRFPITRQRSILMLLGAILVGVSQLSLPLRPRTFPWQIMTHGSAMIVTHAVNKVGFIISPISGNHCLSCSLIKVVRCDDGARAFFHPSAIAGRTSYCIVQDQSLKHLDTRIIMVFSFAARLEKGEVNSKEEISKVDADANIEKDWQILNSSIS